MVKMTVAPTKRPISMKVTLRDQVYFSKQIRSQEEVEIELPRANEYRVEINGDCEVQVPKSTPFVFEASVRNPSWIDYRGPHYFYVPKGTRELIVDATPRLSFFIPGGKARVDISASNRVKGKEYSIIKVPSGAAGKVWQSSPQTRGRVMLLNDPPMMSFHPETLFVPREIAERDGLTTKE